MSQRPGARFVYPLALWIVSLVFGVVVAWAGTRGPSAHSAKRQLDSERVPAPSLSASTASAAPAAEPTEPADEEARGQTSSSESTTPQRRAAWGLPEPRINPFTARAPKSPAKAPAERAPAERMERAFAEPPGLASSLWRMGLSLGGMLALLGGVTWLLRGRLGRRETAGGERASLRILTSRHLAPRRSIHLVEVEGIRLLLGVGPERIVPLLELGPVGGPRKEASHARQTELLETEAEEPFAAEVRRAACPEPDAPAPDKAPSRAEPAPPSELDFPDSTPLLRLVRAIRGQMQGIGSQG